MNELTTLQGYLKIISGMLLLIFAFNRFGRNQVAERLERQEFTNVIREERHKKYHRFRNRKR